MKTVITGISTTGLVPVIKLDSPDQAVPLAQALLRGNLPLAEITFRTDAAEQSITRIARQFPDMLLGAGTVITLEQARRAIAAGARFLVSPGYDDEIADFTLTNDIPFFPGVVTPTEIQRALKKGLTSLKFFPAEPSGGLGMLNALSAPFPQVMFFPTGGVSLGNMQDYLRHPRVLAVGGSWMVPPKAIAQGNWDEITQLSSQAVRLVDEIRNKN